MAYSKVCGRSFVILTSILVLLGGVGLLVASSIGLRNVGNVDAGNTSLDLNSLKTTLYLLLSLGIWLIILSMTGLTGVSIKSNKLLGVYNGLLVFTLFGIIGGGIYSTVKLNSNLNQIYKWRDEDWKSFPEDKRMSWSVTLKCCSFRSPSDGLGPYFDPDCSPQSQVRGCQEALADEMKGRLNSVIISTVIGSLFLVFSLIATRMSMYSNRMRSHSGAMYRQKS